jgi:hypothetical protein
VVRLIPEKGVKSMTRSGKQGSLGRSLAASGLLVACTLATLQLATGARESSPPQTITRDSPATSPLGPDAVEISLEAAKAFASACLCPWLPASGPASPEHVTKAWYDSGFNALALEFNTNLLFTFHPDSRTSAEFVAADQVMVADGIPIQFVSVRGTTASTIVPNVDGRGSPSSVTWREGLDRITIYGMSAQSVNDLLGIVGNMTPIV